MLVIGSTDVTEELKKKVQFDGHEEPEAADESVTKLLSQMMSVPKPKAKPKQAARRVPKAKIKRDGQPDFAIMDNVEGGEQETQEAETHSSADDIIDMDSGRQELDEAEEEPEWTNPEATAAAHDIVCLSLRDQPVLKSDGSCHVYLPSNPSQILGTLKRYDPNTPKERIFLNCKLHGCSKILPISRAPDEAIMLQWFVAGLDLQGPGDKKIKHTYHVWGDLLKGDVRR